MASLILMQSFNPRARDGRETVAKVAFDNPKVSIHAPVMDAKIKSLEAEVETLVSIHAPVMDAKAPSLSR